MSAGFGVWFFLLHFSPRLLQVCVKQICSQVFLTRARHGLHVGKVVQGPFTVVSERWLKCLWLQVSLCAAVGRRQLLSSSPWLSESFLRGAHTPSNYKSFSVSFIGAGAKCQLCKSFQPFLCSVPGIVLQGARSGAGASQGSAAVLG